MGRCGHRSSAPRCPGCAGAQATAGGERNAWPEVAGPSRKRRGRCLAGCALAISRDRGCSSAPFGLARTTPSSVPARRVQRTAGQLPGPGHEIIVLHRGMSGPLAPRVRRGGEPGSAPSLRRRHVVDRDLLAESLLGRPRVDLILEGGFHLGKSCGGDIRMWVAAWVDPLRVGLP